MKRNKSLKDRRGRQKSQTSLTSVAIMASILLCVLAYSAAVFAGENASWTEGVLPPQSVFVDPKSFAVLGENGTFRESSFGTHFNPTSAKPPFFQIFDKSFLKVLGPNPSIYEVASNDTFAFAHEAPIWVPETDEIFFGSNDGGALGNSDLDHNNVVGKINLKDVDKALASHASPINVPVEFLDLPDTVQMTNGGTGPFRKNLLLITSGRGPRPPSIVLVDPKAPHNTTVLLDNYFGRQFNSLNDIKVHPSGKLFFTDVIYGWVNHFRPQPLMPNQVYRLDPDTRQVRVVATDFDKCNGIAFTTDGKMAYIADTGAAGSATDQTAPATIYAFDVDPKSHVFRNRRVFAYADAGVPDGLQVDLQGNVYSGCGDGVQVWNPDGDLIGKFFLGTTSANMVFANPGRLVIMAETKIFVAKIAANGPTAVQP